MPALREKSVRLTGYLETLIDRLGSDRISIITPNNSVERGCQLSIKIKDGDKSIFERLISRGVFADWREPAVIRVAPTPLYNTFSEVFSFVEVLRSCLA